MGKLYAIIDGKNQPVAELNEADSHKIGRGQDVGHSFGIVTDQDTGQQFEVFQANCGGDNCNCAVTVRKILKLTPGQAKALAEQIAEDE